MPGSAFPAIMYESKSCIIVSVDYLFPKLNRIGAFDMVNFTEKNNTTAGYAGAGESESAAPMQGAPFAGYFQKAAVTPHFTLRVMGSLVIAYVLSSVLAIKLIELCCPQLSYIFKLTVLMIVFFVSIFLLLHRLCRLTPADFGFKQPINYIWGSLLGFGLFAAVAAVTGLYGSNSFTLQSHPVNILGIAGVLVMFILQGAGEELLVRGLIFMPLSRKLGMPLALVSSSCIFSVMHFFNPSVNAVAALNLFLFGAVTALMYYCTQNFYLVAGLHSIWNFAQAMIFDFPVSGLEIKHIYPLLENRAHVADLINGGNFGPEASLTTSVLLLAVIAVYVFKLRKAGVSVN